jgi:acyl-lipid omega-6 desaturase (Delta-12 desaturase)
MPGELGEPAAASWRSVLAPYASSDMQRATLDLLGTVILFVSVTAVLIVGLGRSSWSCFALVPLAALLLIRLFTIQHDCGHQSFFPSRRLNDWVGRGIGLLTLTPYSAWRQSHAAHHAGSGNLARRGIGDITLLTVPEYHALGSLRKFLYRVYRHPLTLFVIAPSLQYWILYRFPTKNPFRHPREWMSVLGTNASIALLVVAMSQTVGIGIFLAAYAPITMVAASIGIWLFYIQHNFERTYWRDDSTWDFEAAALEGSSLFDLPKLLHWATNNICFHHIHHLASRIPGYRLATCFRENPRLQSVKRIGFREGCACMRLVLWDEEACRLVSFRDYAGRPKTDSSGLCYLRS